jgi:hypothetical protein
MYIYQVNNLDCRSNTKLTGGVIGTNGPYISLYTERSISLFPKKVLLYVYRKTVSLSNILTSIFSNLMVEILILRTVSTST